MSTPNFYNQKDFDLYIKVFEAISLDEYKKEEFEDGCYFVEYEEAKTEEEKEAVLEKAYNQTMNFWRETFYEDIVYGYDGFNEVMEKFNEELTFHSIELKDGYYEGVQLYVNTTENPHTLDNEDCKYYYDMCRSQAIRKYEAEIRKINKWMKKVAIEYGWRKINCLGVFSNGEAIYEYA